MRFARASEVSVLPQAQKPHLERGGVVTGRADAAKPAIDPTPTPPLSSQGCAPAQHPGDLHEEGRAAVYLQHTNRQSFVEPAKARQASTLRELEQVLEPAR
ncbi:hypothetical protein GCM10017608_25680 [Agromyces luteolus]|nr:hypothetical protein GCM10017608_25680 [Agromyces luteolus]